MVGGEPGTPGLAVQGLVGMVQPHDRGRVTALPQRMGEGSAKVTQHRLLAALNSTVQVSCMVCNKIVRNVPITFGRIVAQCHRCFVNCDILF